jgi:hypothetical protein
MLDIDEVFSTFLKLSLEKVHTLEVQDLSSNLYPLHFSDNESPSDVNLESWKL